MIKQSSDKTTCNAERLLWVIKKIVFFSFEQIAMNMEDISIKVDCSIIQV